MKAISLLLAVSLVSLMSSLRPPQTLAAAASDAARGDYSPLQILKIDAVKQGLRLGPRPEALEDTHPSLYGHYKANRFVALVEAVAALPGEEKSAELLLLYGNALFILGRDGEAVAAYQAAFKRAETEAVKAAATANFGVVLSKGGDPKAAVAWLERALAMDRAAADWRAQAQGLSLLGALYFQIGETEKGAAAHIEALEIAETIPLPGLQARQLNLLAKLYYQDGTAHLARENFRAALAVYRRLGDPLGQAAALSGLALIEKDRGDFERAVSHQEEALAIYRRLEDEGNENHALRNLLIIHRDQGDFEAALGMGRRLRARFEAAGNRNGLAEIEGSLGAVYEKMGEFKAAIRHWEAAMRLFREAGAAQELHVVELRIQALRDRIEMDRDLK